MLNQTLRSFRDFAKTMVLELSRQARLSERRRDRFKRGPTRSVGRFLESERSEDTGRSPNTAHMCRIIDMRSMAMCHFERSVIIQNLVLCKIERAENSLGQYLVYLIIASEYDAIITSYNVTYREVLGA